MSRVTFKFIRIIFIIFLFFKTNIWFGINISTNFSSYLLNILLNFFIEFIIFYVTKISQQK